VFGSVLLRLQHGCSKLDTYSRMLPGIGSKAADAMEDVLSQGASTVTPTGHRAFKSPHRRCMVDRQQALPLRLILARISRRSPYWFLTLPPRREPASSRPGRGSR
jgi:hypothetical protein